MQATDVGQPFHHEGWVYEEKYDGWRMVAPTRTARRSATKRSTQPWREAKAVPRPRKRVNSMIGSLGSRWKARAQPPVVADAFQGSATGARDDHDTANASPASPERK